MTPDPGPYGADLPRKPKAPSAYWQRVLEETEAALDAANAEVLRLRAERDALREVVEAVRDLCETGLSEAQNLPTPARVVARQVLALLPAPTEGDG